MREVLTPEERLIVKNLRAAYKKADASGGNVQISMFVGTPDNCSKLSAFTDLMSIFQEAHPDIPLETFLVPIPTDPQQAEVMRRSLIENITALFRINHPHQVDFN